MSESEITFEAIAADWKKLYDSEPLRTDPRLEELFARLFGPEQRHWFMACTSEIRRSVEHPSGPQDDPGIRQLLERLKRRNEAQARVAHAHLDLCAKMRPFANGVQVTWPSGTLPADVRQEIADAWKMPPGLIRLLAEEMAGASRPSDKPARTFESLIVPVVHTMLHEGEKVQKGALVTLTLELVPNGTNEFYPSPAMSLIARDKDFDEAEENAWKYATETARIWPQGKDVCWTMSRADQPLPAKIEGPSAGGGFAMGLVKLFASALAA